MWRDPQKTTPCDKSPTAWALLNDLTLANTPQDYTGDFITSSPGQLKTPDSSLILLPQDLNKTSEANLSNGSDQESGIADLSCRSPLSEDSTRDPDSDEATYSAAWAHVACGWRPQNKLHLYVHQVTWVLANISEKSCTGLHSWLALLFACCAVDSPCCHLNT